MKIEGMPMKAVRTEYRDGEGWLGGEGHPL